MAPLLTTDGADPAEDDDADAAEDDDGDPEREKNTWW